MVLADAQYSLSKVTEAVQAYSAEPVITVMRNSKVRDALPVGARFTAILAEALAALLGYEPGLNRSIKQNTVRG